MIFNKITPRFCQYCGEPLENGCDCLREIEDYEKEMIEELEERQHQSGFYAFQDLMDIYKFER